MIEGFAIAGLTFAGLMAAGVLLAAAFEVFDQRRGDVTDAPHLDEFGAPEGGRHPKKQGDFSHE